MFSASTYMQYAMRFFFPLLSDGKWFKMLAWMVVSVL
jgi:hypothetical protein